MMGCSYRLFDEGELVIGTTIAAIEVGPVINQIFLLSANRIFVDGKSYDDLGSVLLKMATDVA
jgi:hypothetical protein